MPDIREKVQKELEEQNNAAKRAGADVSTLEFLRLNWIPIALTLIVAGTLIFLAGRFSAGDWRSGGENPVTQLVAADYISVAISDPQKMNPLLTSDEDILYLNDIVYSSLFKMDRKYNLTMDLCKEYETNRDEGSVLITLRSDAIYSDGVGLTAADVVFTHSAILSIGESSHYYEMASKIELIEQISQYELRIIFRDPHDAALDNLCFPIIREDGYSNFAQILPGTGPYAYYSYSVGSSIRLVPNEYYYGENKATLPIVCIVVQPRSAVPYLISTDEITAALSDNRLAGTWVEDGKIIEKPMVSSSMAYIGFNCKEGPSSDVNLRHVAAKAINRERILKRDYRDEGVISDSIFVPEAYGTFEEEKPVYDAELAKAMLADSGYSDSDGDGVVENMEGANISLRIIVENDKPALVAAADHIAEDLAAVGIAAKTERLSHEEYEAALISGAFDVFLAETDAATPSELFELIALGNHAGFDDSETISAYHDVLSCITPEEMVPAFETLRASLTERMPYMSIFHKYRYFWGNGTLETGIAPQAGAPYRNALNWSWRKKVVAENEAE